MKRATTFAVLVGVAAGVCAAPIPKDDDVTRMVRAYGLPHDIEKDSRFAMPSDTLRITVPSSRRLLSPWSKVYNAPRLWRDVTGGFSVTVRVSFPIRKTIPEKHTEPQDARASAGLVVWADDKNCMTLTRDEREIDNEPGEFFRAEWNFAGSAKGSSIYVEPSNLGFVRVERIDNVLRASYSPDGKKWKALGNPYTVTWGDTLKVGVVVENNYRTEFSAGFGEYALTQPKK